MSEISHPAMEIVTHGIAWLKFEVAYLSNTRKPLAANRLFQAKFWEEARAAKLEDLGISYHEPEPGTVRVFLQFVGEYCADDRGDIAAQNKEWGYFEEEQLARAQTVGLVLESIRAFQRLSTRHLRARPSLGAGFLFCGLGTNKRGAICNLIVEKPWRAHRNVEKKRSGRPL